MADTEGAPRRPRLGFERPRAALPRSPSSEHGFLSDRSLGGSDSGPAQIAEAGPASPTLRQLVASQPLRIQQPARGGASPAGTQTVQAAAALVAGSCTPGKLREVLGYGSRDATPRGLERASPFGPAPAEGAAAAAAAASASASASTPASPPRPTPMASTLSRAISASSSLSRQLSSSYLLGRSVGSAAELPRPGSSSELARSWTAGPLPDAWGFPEVGASGDDGRRGGDEDAPGNERASAGFGEDLEDAVLQALHSAPPTRPSLPASSPGRAAGGRRRGRRPSHGPRDAGSPAPRATPGAPARRRRPAPSSPPSSSLRTPGRHVSVVTTAALPWLTGTAVNPALRAAYLADEDPTRRVLLVLPWLEAEDQAKLFGDGGPRFEDPASQAHWIARWLKERTELPWLDRLDGPLGERWGAVGEGRPGTEGEEGPRNGEGGLRGGQAGGTPPRLGVAWYAARYEAALGSILPSGDPTLAVPSSLADVAVLEEPEHLTWLHAGQRWRSAFTHVVGVAHTNYLAYVRRERGGRVAAAALATVNGVVVRAHCHRVIKLSDAVQRMPREVVEFVHGVPDAFLRLGAEFARALEAHGANPPPGAGSGGGSADPAPLPSPYYYLGKALWAKGYDELLDLLGRGSVAGVRVEAVGSGEDAAEIVEKARAAGLEAAFSLSPGRDHLEILAEANRMAAERGEPDAEPASRQGRGVGGAGDAAPAAPPTPGAYLPPPRSVFVNPCSSDVVATSTAEALAAGRWAVVSRCPANAPFAWLPNCLAYSGGEEFAAALATASSQPPAPLSERERAWFTWRAATERFLDASELGPRELRPSRLEAALDGLAWKAHRAVAGLGDLIKDGVAAGRADSGPAGLATDAPPSSSGPASPASRAPPNPARAGAALPPSLVPAAA